VPQGRGTLKAQAVLRAGDSGGMERLVFCAGFGDFRLIIQKAAGGWGGRFFLFPIFLIHRKMLCVKKSLNSDI